MNLFNTISLKGRLISLFLSICLVPITISSWLVYRNFYNEMADISITEVSHHAKNNAQLIKTAINKFNENVLMLANTPPPEAIVRAKNNKGIDPISKDSVGVWVKRLSTIFLAEAIKGYYFNIRFLDSNGDELVKVNYKDGNSVAVSDNDLKKKGHTDYFKEAMLLSKGQVYISKLNLNRERKIIEIPYRPVLKFSTPIFSKEGKAQGVVVFNVKNEFILESLKIYSLDNVTLSNMDGYYIYHIDPDRTFGFEFNRDSLTISNDMGESVAKLGDRESYTGRHDNSFVALKKVFFDPLNKARYWLITDFIPFDTIERPITNMKQHIMIFAAVAAFFACIIAYLVAKGITDPISDAVNMAIRLANGQLDAYANTNTNKAYTLGLIISGSPEIVTLGSALERMRLSLMKSMSQIIDKEVKLKNIFNSSGIAMITANESGYIDSLNTAAQKLFGYSNGELIGKSITALMPKDLKGMHAKSLVDAKKLGLCHVVNIDTEVSGVRKNGGIFPIRLVVSEVILSGTRTFIASILDLSAIKKAQSEEKNALAELEKERAKLAELYWQKTVSLDITEKLQGIRDIKDLAYTLIANILPEVGGSVVVFYIKEEDEKGPFLRLLSSYAYNKTKDVPEVFRMGEGLVGQSGLEKKDILITDAPKDYIKISSGLGEAAPKSIMILPVIFEDDLLAVIELCSFSGFTAVQQSLIKQVVSNVGIFIHNILSR